MSYKLMIIKLYIWDLFINSLLASFIIPIYARRFLLNLMGSKIYGIIHAKCYLGSKNIYVGMDSYLNKFCILDNENGALIHIGDNCSIGYCTSFLTTNHNYRDENKRGGAVYGKDIIVEDGCWIGANSTILSGVTIKRGCIVAAGAMVTKSTEENSLYAGIPAKKIKYLK